MAEPIYMEQEAYEAYLQRQEELKQESNKDSSIGSTTLYDLNKAAVRSLKKMTNMEINNALEKVRDWYHTLIDDDGVPPQYFMFLEREHNYYTLFVDTKMHLEPDKTLIKELKDLLMNWYADKDVRAIDVDEASGAIEIWAMWDGEPTVAYLFPYDKGVIEY